MGGILTWIRFFRLPNLIMVLLALWLPAFFFFKSGEINERLFFWVALNVVLTTLAGYIINDYFDVEADAVNKPGRLLVGQVIPRTAVFRLYVGLVLLSMVLAAGIDRLHSGAYFHWPLWLFPSVALLLFVYSKWLKCTVLWGNLLVSLLCGLVPLVLLFITTPQAGRKYEQLLFIGIYAGFAFVSNLFREVVKDLQDVAGDAAQGCGTLPVRLGAPTARTVALSVGTLLLLMVIAVNWMLTPMHIWAFYGSLALAALVLFAEFAVLKASSSRQYGIASNLIKLSMLLGLVVLVFFTSK